MSVPLDRVRFFAKTDCRKAIRTLSCEVFLATVAELPAGMVALHEFEAQGGQGFFSTVGS